MLQNEYKTLMILIDFILCFSINESHKGYIEGQTLRSKEDVYT